jgi:hypothetical protein
MRFVASLFLIVALAGCISGDGEITDPAPPTPAPTHALFGATEPDDFEAPTFVTFPAVAKGGPLYGAGEPSIWAALNGDMFVAFPGCDDGPYYIVSYPDSETCGHGLVFKSTDNGQTWDRLNSHGNGRLTEDGPLANGDADITVDAAGTIYTSNLGGGIQFHRSLDGGETWEYMANLVPPSEDADRQWLAAAAPGQVINAWMRTSPARDVAINSTFDGGVTWTNNTYFGDTIGWLGTPQFDASGEKVYIPYTQPIEGVYISGIAVGETFEMHVIKSLNGGRNWTDVPTGMIWTTTATGAHWSGGHMAPTLDVTGDGTVVVGMAIDDYPPGAPISPTNIGSVIIISASSDDGETWTQYPSVAPPSIESGGSSTAASSGSAIFPWITGGAGDRFAVTYYHSVTPTDQDVAAGTWDLRVAYVDGISAGELEIIDIFIDDDVHEGPICTRGSICAGPGDRTLLDFFESDINVDGNLVVVYPADPLTGGKEIEIRVAIQNGGTPLATTLKSNST